MKSRLGKSIVDMFVAHPIIMAILLVVLGAIAVIFIKYILAIIMVVFILAAIIFAIIGIRKTNAPIPIEWKAILVVGITVTLVLAAFSVNKMAGVSAYHPPYCQYGDVTGDGVIDEIDANAISSYTNSWSWDKKERADVNNDGIVDFADQNLILQYTMDIIDDFPVHTGANWQVDGIPEITDIDVPTSVIKDVGFVVTVWGNDSNGEYLNYKLYYTKPDGSTSDEIYLGRAAPNMPVTHTLVFRTTGDYRIYFRAYDNGWGTVNPNPSELRYVDVTVFHEEQPPYCAFTYQQSGLEVRFNDQSYDLDGNIVSWSWDFGDGGTSNSQNPIHTYSSYGAYTVSLTVTDNDGLSTTHAEHISLGTQYTLTTFVYPNGAGTVSPSSGSYNAGDMVAITATPASGYSFSYWSGDVTGNQNTINVVMDSDKTIVANFIEVGNKYILSYSVSPQDSGTVSLYPPGGAYDAGDTITLTAKPSSGYKFDHWEGAVVSRSSTTTLVMPAQDVNVTAYFVRETSYIWYLAGGIISLGLITTGVLIYRRRRK